MYEDNEAVDLQLRVEKTMLNKIERGVTKGIITDAEAKKLAKALKKTRKLYDEDWWLEEKIYKSFEIAMHQLKEQPLGDYYEEIEILQKIEKA